MQDYIQRLKQLREEKKWTITDVAGKLQIPEQYLAMIELGELVPSDEQYDAITEFVLDSI